MRKYVLATATAVIAGLGAVGVAVNPTSAGYVTESPGFTSESVFSPEDFISPTLTLTVVREYAPGENNWNAGHRGVDLSAWPGQPIVAAGDGMVIYAAVLNDRGVVSIEHANGLRTTYEPVNATVKKGDQVRAGDVIGTVADGHCLLTCLHWGAKFGRDDYINPLALLGLTQVRLYE